MNEYQSCGMVRFNRHTIHFFKAGKATNRLKQVTRSIQRHPLAIFYRGGVNYSDALIALKCTSYSYIVVAHILHRDLGYSNTVSSLGEHSIKMNVYFPHAFHTDNAYGLILFRPLHRLALVSVDSFRSLLSRFYFSISVLSNNLVLLDVQVGRATA